MVLEPLFEGAWGLKILTSKYVFSKRPPQNPLTAMSSLAPSVLTEVAPFRTSPVSGCRSGSTRTSWQTSVRRAAITSRISLWRMMGNPPLGHESTCSTVKVEPHSQWRGTLDGGHPYLRARASLNAPLCRQNPNSSMGREVNQFEAPFSLASSMVLFCFVVLYQFLQFPCRLYGHLTS